ncbi:HAD family hydrolase [Enterococcus sp. AZ072]|uniref:HAD family hydrolase n=1 Tax=unclassified Enterococcus TaxID=2608891 RepID=UPI003D2D00A8
MQAVIFDMDGVLIDTEKVSKQAFTEAFESVGLNFTEELYQQILGRSLKDIEVFLEETFQHPSIARQIIQQREIEFAKYYQTHPVEVKSGIFDFLAFIKNRRLKTAVATSAKESIAVPLLEQAGLIQHFDTFTFGSQVKEAKPHPELFLKAADSLAVRPEEAVVIEDSESGIIAANQGGFQAVFIPETEPTQSFRQQYNFSYYQQVQDFQASLQK